jgi:hypothetical protein
MANTLSGINWAKIAQETLKVLLDEMPALRAFTTDFSADIKDVGESVTTRVPTAVTAGDASSGYTATDVTSTAKTITLDKHRHFTMAFTDLEVAKGGLEFLRRIFVRPAAHAVVNNMVDDTLALVTNANFGAAAFTGAASTFDADDVADLAETLTTAKVPKQNRFLMVKPTYYAALTKDSSIQVAMNYGGAEAIRENQIPRLHGFGVHQYTDIPANAENLVGLCGSQEGLLIAARQPVPPSNWFGQVESATDPDTGLTIQIRAWYEGKDGKHYCTATIIYGVAVGVTANVKRLVSA